MDYRKSLGLDKNGDIHFDNLGKLIFIDFEQKIIQTIKLKLSTLKGELFYNENYGIELFNKIKINKEILESAIRNAIMDDWVIDAKLVSYEKSKEDANSYNVVLEIYLFNGQIIYTTTSDGLIIGGA